MAGPEIPISSNTVGMDSVVNCSYPASFGNMPQYDLANTTGMTADVG